MTVVASDRRAAAEPAATRRSPDGDVPRRRNAETIAWIYTRISALAMVILVLAHLAIMHLTGARDALSAAFVRSRLAEPGWLAFDLALLVLALSHGMTGLRAAGHDHVSSGRTRSVVTWACAIVTVVLAVFGTLVLALLHLRT